ncbi:ABC transporter substrate-binding protein [Clostridium magnum]|uniref:Leucine-, isoleucine-, valine-, threonine-, and alanine-binding protein n=1 Tax=Clostridium magnum DSM 2767 TaxID=1121326 RepID=A0A162TE40_9CLOT|nr:ABC transporter substrate-binding protein [Clostridium magnum]KZL92530.1 leucine-, isoleucine-, valine-, threonine-, and alanine-binding protein precursor [Clostridium magnum DSM 2767]SHI80043.1 amino acid/amide ABC transporter substrate-binding protein, HAAT family (TC 3.A.1.4.-) [Clostridium magnum DSM 2767]
MRKKISILLAALFVTGSLAGCGKNTATSGKSDTIKVGLNYELSGPVATYGQSLTDGITLAVEEINKNGGVLGKQIETVKVDNKSENAESANVATKLATRDKVVAILGAATSGNTKAAAPIAVQNKVPLISASATADDVTVDSNGKVREYVFKTCFSDSFQGVGMANFAYNDLGKKNVALLVDSTSDYSKGLTKSFKETYTKLGGQIVTEQAYQAKETDFKAVLTKIKGANPDVIFLPGYYEEVGLIVKQARELGLNVPVLGGDGYDSPKLAELAGKSALNGVYYTNHYSSKDTSAEVVKFREVFKAKYNKEPDAFNALGYDLAYLLADATKRSGEANPEKIKDALAATKEFKGVTGTVTIDKNHNPIKSITVLEMKDGEQTFVKKVLPQ